jgi:hypothetical protein
MSLPQDTLLELMALADGELEGEAKARAEKLVAESDEARRVVAAMCAPDVGVFLGEALEGRVGAADGIADAVMARLGAERGQEGGVVRLADARGAKPASKGPRMQVFAAVGAALALAAGILLYIRSQDMDAGGTPVASVNVPSIDLQPPPAPTAVAQQAARPSQGVEVDEIDSPSRDVSVFEIPLGAAAAVAGGGSPSSVVIMIDDDKGAR